MIVNFIPRFVNPLFLHVPVQLLFAPFRRTTIFRQLLSQLAGFSYNAKSITNEVSTVSHDNRFVGVSNGSRPRKHCALLRICTSQPDYSSAIPVFYHFTVCKDKK